MKVSKFKSGVYIVTIHNKSFSLEKLTDDKYWTLYNDKMTEINRSETKSGMLELMKTWSEARVAEYSLKESCDWV